LLDYNKAKDHLKNNQYTWLITGAAGFIGSNLLENLLKLNQKVIGLDNLSTGSKDNINKAIEDSGLSQKNELFKFIEGDVSDYTTCKKYTAGVDFVLHQAALGSVPRSIKNPLDSNNSNVSGFLNMLYAAKEESVESFVYASSSSVYGSDVSLPKVEENTGEPLSPYALTKSINEQYSEVFSKTYDFNSIGLRYFNVFGKRQNIHGPYAAVIPKWIIALINEEPVQIYGDGLTSRDFCYVQNAVQANILAALSKNSKATGRVYNVALNDTTSLTDLYAMIKSILINYTSSEIKHHAEYLDFRPGDIKSSQADISKIVSDLGYVPSHKIKEGLLETVKWYIDNNE
jgi:UDP-N-acetylglucosamine 4-epimerase